MSIVRRSNRKMGRMGRKCGPKSGGPAHWRALEFIGAGEKSRTPDLRITNALLYQLSYTGAEKRQII